MLRRRTSPEGGDEQQQGRAHGQCPCSHEECLRARSLFQFVRHERSTLNHRRELGSACLRPSGKRRQADYSNAHCSRWLHIDSAFFTDLDKWCAQRRRWLPPIVQGRNEWGAASVDVVRAGGMVAAMQTALPAARARPCRRGNRLFQPKRQWNRWAAGAGHHALSGRRCVRAQRAGFARNRNRGQQARREG